MERRFLSQKGSGVGRGVKEKQSLMADKSVKVSKHVNEVLGSNSATRTPNVVNEKINDVGTVNNVVNNGTTVGPTPAGNTHGMSTSYVNVTGEPCRKAANFRTLITPAGNRVDMVVLMKSIKAISECTWKTFGGNTRDLGSILEETRQDYDFTPKEGLKNKSQMVETASGKLVMPSRSASDGVRISCDGLGEMLHKQRNDMHEQFSQIPSPLRAEYKPPILRNLPSPSLLDQGPPHVIYPTHLLHSHPQPMKRLKWKDPKIHINLPFHEVMIHMPKGAKVLKDLLSHKEKLKKASSSVKLSEECSTVIQRSFPQKEGDPGSFTLHCLTGPLTVKNALANLGASINLMPHSLFQKLRISELKPTRMILEMDEDELVPIILGRPFLATARAVIDVHEGKLSLRVGSKIAPENCPKPSISEPPRLELKEIAEHLKYDFLQGDDHLLVVISSTLSIYEKAKLLEVLRKHKGEIAWSVADIKGIDSSFCTHKILIEDECKPTV
ncbi:hypothetical protein Tco_0421885 [Tanacetum coccineum]